MSERISREDLIRVYQVEVQFFDDLVNSGLLTPISDGNTQYLEYRELPVFERFITWHYDLEVNMPGLEVIHGLLRQLQELRDENRRLLGHYRAFQHDIDGDF